MQIAPCYDENGKKNENHVDHVCGFAEILEKNGFARGHKPLTAQMQRFRGRSLQIEPGKAKNEEKFPYRIYIADNEYIDGKESHAAIVF